MKIKVVALSFFEKMYIKTIFYDNRHFCII